eukprot:4270921-Amphidinium_carterae.1
MLYRSEIHQKITCIWGQRQCLASDLIGHSLVVHVEEIPELLRLFLRVAQVLPQSQTLVSINLLSVCADMIPQHVAQQTLWLALYKNMIHHLSIRSKIIVYVM